MVPYIGSTVSVPRPFCTLLIPGPFQTILGFSTETGLPLVSGFPATPSVPTSHPDRPSKRQTFCTTLTFQTSARLGSPSPTPLWRPQDGGSVPQVVLRQVGEPVHPRRGCDCPTPPQDESTTCSPSSRCYSSASGNGRTTSAFSPTTRHSPTARAPIPLPSLPIPRDPYRPPRGSQSVAGRTHSVVKTPHSDAAGARSPQQTDGSHQWTSPLPSSGTPPRSSTEGLTQRSCSDFESTVNNKD